MRAFTVLNLLQVGVLLVLGEVIDESWQHGHQFGLVLLLNSLFYHLGGRELEYSTREIKLDDIEPLQC